MTFISENSRPASVRICLYSNTGLPLLKIHFFAFPYISSLQLQSSQPQSIGIQTMDSELKTKKYSAPGNPSTLDHTTLQFKTENLELQSLQHLVKQCRICLSSNDQPTNPFISPCECAGSLKYVHHSCLRQWLEVKVSQNSDAYSAKSSVGCELCQKSIRVKIQLYRECKKPAKICSDIIETPVLFVVCLLGIAISLGVLIYSLSVFSHQIAVGYDSTDTISKTVVLVSMPIELLLFIYFAVMLMKYFVGKRAKLQLDDGS